MLKRVNAEVELLGCVLLVLKIFSKFSNPGEGKCRSGVARMCVVCTQNLSKFSNPEEGKCRSGVARMCVVCAQNLSKFSNPEEGKCRSGGINVILFFMFYGILKALQKEYVNM